MNKIRIFILLIIITYTGCLPGRVAGSALPEAEEYFLSFEQFMREVRNNNLEYAAERFNVQIAEAEYIASKVLPDPELELEASEEVYFAALGWTIEMGGKRKARMRLARSQAELEGLALEFFFTELSADAARIYTDAVVDREILRFRVESYEYMRQLSRSDSIRFALGEITENEYRQTRIEAVTLLNDVYEQEAVYHSSLVELARVMGWDMRRSVHPVSFDPKGLEVYPLDRLLELAFDNRVDLIASLKNSEVAMNELRLVRAERRIDLDIFVGYERDWHGWRPDRHTVKGGLTIPIPFSNTNKGAIRAARYAVDQAATEWRLTEQSVEAEVLQAHFNYTANRKSVEQYESGLLAESRKVLDGIVYTYQRGETDVLEVLVAQRTHNELQEQYFQTLREYRYSIIDLYRSCGLVVSSFDYVR